jgi:vacuolar-type H+-ATPase subunit C/Vma6
MSRLNSVTRLSELDRLIFASAARDLPERELLADLERRVIDRSVKQIITLVDSFSSPPELLERLIRSYEYGDMKSALNAITAGENKVPVFTDLGRFGTVKFAAYPDLPAMIRGTEFESPLKDWTPVNSGDEGIMVQIKLDGLYYGALWKSLFAVPKRDRLSIERIVTEEIALRNAVWALRLRTYYGMSVERTRERLVCLDPGGGKGSLADDAITSLSMALDNYADWASWKRAGFLNPPQPGESWTADPRYFQNAASEHLYRLARLSFRRRPFSIDTTSCFIKLKQFEEDILTSVAEGLGLGMSAGDVFALLEVAP